MSEIIIHTVAGKADLKRFIRVQYDLYKDDVAAIPPLMLERLNALDPRKNPFFDHAETAFFIAVRDGQDVGTISVQIDALAQEKWGPDLGHFGLFEASDPAVAQALFKAAEDWHRERGSKRLQGPWNLSSNEQSGLLVDGFDTPPVIMMPHGKAEYAAWVEACGFEEAKKMFAFKTDPRKPFDPKTERIASMSRKSSKIVIRPIDMKNFRSELDIVLDIFNDAWADNWGYVPMTEAEIEHMAKELKPIINPKLVLVAEFEGKPMGFIMTIPDVNHFLRDLNGSLFPTGIFKLIWRLMINKQSPRFRTPLMGLRQEMQGNRLGMAMMFDLILQCTEEVVARGGGFAEMGWILENNSGMINMIEALDSDAYKTYKIYEKQL